MVAQVSSLVAHAAAISAAAYAIVLWRQRAGRKAALESVLASHFDGGTTASLDELVVAAGKSLDSVAFTAAMDAAEPLHALRDDFHIPMHQPDEQQAYFAGNSLGLQPRSTATTVGEEMDKWAARGVCGHFEGRLPWARCEEALPELFADMVGAKDAQLEVGAMNSLTVNLHMLMAAFYRPSEGRAAILIEAGAFPSDRYAVGSQVLHWGRDPTEWVIEVQPRDDSLLHTEDIIKTIEANRDRLALVLLSGVNYRTGQVMDMPKLSAHMRKLNEDQAAQGRPAIPFGLDLAHAIGNVPLSLHEWHVDFAAWCTYKYLHAGAGCLGALYVHSDHARDSHLYPRLSGWWGVPFKSRFEMAHRYEEAAGAPAFGVSNVNPLMVACVEAGLRSFQRAGGVRRTRRKSLLLTGYLEALLRERGLLKPVAGASLELVTPHEPSRRGCQLSLRVLPNATGRPKGTAQPPMTMRALEAALARRGVVVDSREPDIVRISPAPLYNSFGDVRKAVDALEKCLADR